MAKQNKIPDFSAFKQKIIEQRPRMVAVEAEKFFKDGFRKGGFTDAAFQAWRQRTNPLGGKKILIGKDNTMNLMQSIRPLEINSKRVRVGTDLPYGEIHNDGGIITVTKQMKKFWWAKYYEFAGKTEKKKDGRTRNNARNRSINTKAQYCKNMALMKIGSRIRIPKRQFIGESKMLIAKFEAWFAEEEAKLNSI